MKRRNFLRDVALTSILLACNKRNILPEGTSVHSSATNELMISTDYLHFNSYGQSLSIGGANRTPTTVVSTVQKYDSVMANLGVRSVDYGTKTPTKFVPLIEKLSAATVLGETLCSGSCDMFNQAMGAKTFRMHAAASGASNSSVLQLAKGTKPYQRLIRDIQTAKNIAVNQGKTFSAGAIGWTQGEKDYTDNTSYNDYKLRLGQLNADVNNDVALITQQTAAIPFIIGQTSSHNKAADSMADPNIACAQLDLCINHPNFTLAGPMYMLDYWPDNTHLPAISYRILASYYGYAMKKLLIDGVKNFIYPKEHHLENTTLVIKFNVPVAPLVFDTERVVNPGNFGFSVKDSNGGNISISAIDIVDGDTVRIACASIPSTASYAVNGTIKKAGRLLGPRGCLRDSQGDTIVFDPSGTNWKLHNWTPIFKLTV